MATPHARKPWALIDDETLNSYHTWQSIIFHNLTLDANWSQFLDGGIHHTREKKSAAHPLRGLPADAAPIPQSNRKTATQKYIQLELKFGYVYLSMHLSFPEMLFLKTPPLYRTFSRS